MSEVGGVVLECADGWLPLIQKLDADIRNLCPDYRVEQIKEKFGGLRYYYCSPLDASEFVRDHVEALVCAAEDASFEICELCGAKGELRNVQGWWRTLCDSCFNNAEQWRLKL